MNSDPDWDTTDTQWGHLQDEKLVQLFGEERDGSIFNTQSKLIVESVKADALGGFGLNLSDGYVLRVFPASSREMEWLFSRKTGENLALVNGSIVKGRLGQ